MHDDRKNKITLVFICFCLLFLGVLAKAFYIQVYENNYYLTMAQKQIFKVTKIYPQRGGIYDRNGFPLAVNTKTYSIFTMPKDIQDGMKKYRELSKIVPKLSFQSLKKKVKNRVHYTWLARKISLNKDQVNRIKKIKGIYIEEVPKRMYPNHELLSQTLGFVGVDNIGLSGLEYQFDKQLRGKFKVVKYFKDAKGRLIKFQEAGVSIGELPKDIHLSIDKEIQAVAEKELKEAVLKHEALGGGIGVLSARTGEILAMANYPTFDPNSLKSSRPENRKLAFVSDPFEPGSTFKAITIAAALEHKIATPRTHYYCERGQFKVENHTITEASRNKLFEWLSLREIMKYSSNIGTTKIAFDLTFPKLKETIKKFGIGRKTGIELPGESRGIFTEKTHTSPLNLSNISFGQGVATTGIQMLFVFATIANKGIAMPPTLIKDKNKKVKGIPIISEKTAEELVEMFISVVEKGTGTNAQVPYFNIAGKTSTAQRLKRGGGYKGYIPGFIGFPVNVKNPFVVYAYIEAPQGKEYYGNTVAAPLFKKVAQYILYKNKDFDSLALKGEGRERREGKRYNLGKKPKASKTRANGNGMPNFLGLDKVSAKKLAFKAGLLIVQKGVGIVSSQNPQAKTSIGKNATVELIYSPPRYE